LKSAHLHLLGLTHLIYLDCSIGTENFKQGLRIESSDKKGNESESSDAEICVLIQCKAKFRGLAANNLLQILRESHALSKMIKPLGFNADEYVFTYFMW